MSNQDDGLRGSLSAPGTGLTAYVGRQPILDRQSITVGYELFYHGEPTADEPEATTDKAVGAMLSNVLLEFGIERVVGVLPVWVDFPRSYLLESLPIPIPPSRLVVGVRIDAAAPDTLTRRLAALVQQGYEIAIDDTEFGPQHAPLLALAEYVKLDARRNDESLAAVVRFLEPYGVGLVAENVETTADFERCLKHGFQWFEGYFVCRPELLAQPRLPTNRGPLIRLLSELHREDVDLERIQELVGRDVTLSYQALRYLNSPIFALSRPVDSIRHAVVLLGVERLRNLVTLVAVGRISDKPSELLTTALVRARTCELLASLATPTAADSLFTVGLFSLLDALMGLPLDEILRRVPLKEELARALTHREGPAGKVLVAVEHHERGDWHGITQTGLSPVTVSVAWLEAVSWVNAVRSLTSTTPLKSRRTSTRNR